MDVQTRPLMQTQRLRHQCGRFLGEIRNGRLYVACSRCKDLVPVILEQPCKELRISQESLN